MAKAKAKNNHINKSRKIHHEIIGVLVAGLGLFSFLSLYTSSAGILGESFSVLLKGLFGIASFIIPFIVLAVGILIIIAFYKKVNPTKLLLFCTSVIFFICIIHLIYFRQMDHTSLWNFISSSFQKGLEMQGTGAIFAAPIFLLYRLLGLAGSYLFFITMFIIDLLLLTNLSLRYLGRNIYKKIQVGAKEIKQRKNSHVSKPFVGETIPVDEIDEVNTHHDNILPLSGKNAAISPETQTSHEDIQPIKIVDFEASKCVKQSESEKVESDSSTCSAEGTCIGLSHLNDGTDSHPYTIPPLNLLQEPIQNKGSRAQEKLALSNAKLLEDTLSSFQISAKVIQVSRGPAITRYELQPAPGVKVSRIVNLSDDIALNLAAPGVRIEAPIPGKAAVGVEVPNKDVALVTLREVLQSDSFASHTSKLSFALGKDVAGKNIITDIAKMPHLLIAGATGSGKSVCINTIIISILYKSTPDEVKLIMIDPKVVELNTYNGIPHLLIPVVTDPKKAAGALNWAVQEMTSRYKQFAEKGVRDLERYNDLMKMNDESCLPHIVVIIDELADLMLVAPGDVEDAICRLAQMARAAGIHLVIATQRPSVDVITGVIKANIPSRIAFAVSSQIDSRTILDMGGAEKLLGRGDMLFYPSGANKPIRVQGAYISEKEVESVVEYIKNQNEAPVYNTDVLEEIAAEQDSGSLSSNDYDELLPEAIEIVIDVGQASISMLQRRLRVGYARAARLIDEMEVRGIVSGYDGSKPRNVLISRDEFEQQYKGQT